jgi:hypothetical protein
MVYRHNTSNKKTIYIFALLTILPLYLVLFKPILWPFADDWLIIGWNSREKSLFDSDSIQLVNGHQVFLSKALIHVLGYISASNIQLISLVTIVMGFIGILFLVKSQITFLGEKANLIFIFAILVISSNYKQMQNFFMPMCNGWMMAIFFIGIYYWLKQKNDFHTKKYLIALPVILAPLTIGLGLILPIIELIENIYKIIKRKKYLVKFSSQVFISFVSALSIIFFFTVPLLILEDGSGFPVNKNFDNIFNIFKHPIGSLLYLLTLIGNIFVPASRFEPTLPILAGSLFIIISLWILLKYRSKIEVEDIVLNKNCTLGGLIFIIILFLFRYSGNPSDIQVVAAPRYVTGSLIFIIGILGLIQKVGNNRKFITLLLLITSSLTLISGLKTGLEWHTTRYKQSQILVECAKTKDSLETKFVEGKSCFKLAYENSMSPSKEYFNLELRDFIETINHG